MQTDLWCPTDAKVFEQLLAGLSVERALQHGGHGVAFGVHTATLALYHSCAAAGHLILAFSSLPSPATSSQMNSYHY